MLKNPLTQLVLGIGAALAIQSNTMAAPLTFTGGVPNIPEDDIIELHISGSTAIFPFIQSFMTSNRVPASKRLCDMSQMVYVYRDTATTGRQQQAYLCTLNKTGNPDLAGIAKTYLLMEKNNIGDSGLGVAPLISGTPINFLKIDAPATCTVASTGVVGQSPTQINCPYTEGAHLEEAQLGISDVEPDKFIGENAPGGFPAITKTAGSLGRLTVKPFAAQIFGIVVTLNLRNALQEAQFGKGNSCVSSDSLTCMPSLGQAQLASLFTGKLFSWKQVKLGTRSNLFDSASEKYRPFGETADRVHICSGAEGSGTGAAFNIKFLNYPCAGTGIVDNSGVVIDENPSMLEGNDDGIDTIEEALAAEVLTPDDEGEVEDATRVHAMTTAPGIGECLSELNNGDNDSGPLFNNYWGQRWAIGVQGTYHNSGRNGAYRFVKVDGAEPTIDNVVRGLYKNWVELTVNYNTAAFNALSGDEKELIEEFIERLEDPVNIGATNTASATHIWGHSGMLAIPGDDDGHSPKANGTVDRRKPVNPLTHRVEVDADPEDIEHLDACRLPTLFDGDDADASEGIQLRR